MNGVFMNTRIDKDFGVYEAFMLHKNGYFYYPGYIESINELEKLLAEEAEYIKKNPKIIDKRNSAWGCFSITDSTIRMQYFYELHGGRFGLMQLSGQLLTKDSFVITQHVNHHKKVFVEQDTFLLRPFVKLDSTNWLQREKCKELEKTRSR